MTSPASRGIGLALARRLLQTTDLPVVATARADISATRDHILNGLKIDGDRLSVLEVNVTGAPSLPYHLTVLNSDGSTNGHVDEKSISAAAAYCKDRFPSTHLHLAFLVPGILYPERSPAQVSAPHALETFQINALGPLLLAKHFSPFLPARSTPLPLEGQNNTLPSSAVMALMSARVGSISDNQLGGWYSYRASKAAVNSIAKSMDIYLQQKAATKAMCISMHPGTVKTGLSKEFWGNVKQEKLFSPEFAAERLMTVVKNLGTDGRGKCWDWDGKEIPP